jgi:O-antigen ligase
MDNPQDKTADERLWSWSIGWIMYKHNPVIGVGAGNYPCTNHLYATESPMYTPKRKIMGGRQAHSIYFTLLPELGTIGAVLYFGILIAMVNRFRAVRSYFLKQEVPSDDATRFYLLFKAMLASCFAYLVSGAFISVLYYPPFWHLVGIVAVTYRVARVELPGFAQQTESVPSRKAFR